MANLPAPILVYGSNNCNRIRKPNSYQSFCVSESQLLTTSYVNSKAYSVGLPENFSFNIKKMNSLTFLHILPNAVVVRDGDVYVKNIKIVLQRCKQNLNYENKILKLIKPFEDKIFTIAQFWGQGFFHATIEDLPRISPYIDFLRIHTDIKVHVYSKENFIIALLERMGIVASRIIAGNVRAHLIYMPAGTACGTPTTFNSQLLSLYLRSQIPFSPEERKSIIVIKRSTKRYFKNHNEIINTIKDHLKGTDISVEVFSDKEMPSLSETMAMFNRAFMVIGPHGAGESNLIFSEPGTIVIEGLCPNVKDKSINMCYRNLMNTLGHHYYGYIPKKTCFDITAEELVPLVDFFVNNFYKVTMKYK